MRIKILTLILFFTIGKISQLYAQVSSKYYLSSGINFNYSLNNSSYHKVYSRIGYGFNFIGISDKWGIKNKSGYLELGYIKKNFYLTYNYESRNYLFTEFQFKDESQYSNLAKLNTFYLKYGLNFNLSKALNWIGGIGIDYSHTQGGETFTSRTISYNSNLGTVRFNENFSIFQSQVNASIFTKLIFTPTQKSGLAVGLDFAIFKLKPVYMSSEITHGPNTYNLNYSFAPRLINLSFSYLYYFNRLSK